MVEAKYLPFGVPDYYLWASSLLAKPSLSRRSNETLPNSETGSISSVHIAKEAVTYFIREEKLIYTYPNHPNKSCHSKKDFFLIAFNFKRGELKDIKYRCIGNGLYLELIHCFIPTGRSTKCISELPVVCC